MESTARDTEYIQEWMQSLLSQLVRREWSAASVDEEQLIFVIVLLEMNLQPYFQFSRHRQVRAAGFRFHTADRASGKAIRGFLVDCDEYC
jgi:hypothetical protein